MNEAIRNFFYPKTVMVVGASTKPGSIGYEFINTIKSCGYKGELLPINPKADEIHGIKCYHTIEEVDKTVDLAVVMVPKKFAEETIDTILARGIKSIVLITAGFKETGEEGAAVEERLLAKVKAAGARMVGPNCMGVIGADPSVSLNATFVAEPVYPGKVGFASQSGALAVTILNQTRITKFKFAHFISVGNKADINENDFLHFWQEDENIKTFAYYLESFINGTEFVKPFILGEVTKPCIVLKAGRTESGMKAASSHTGALGGSDRVVDAILNQAGVIRADDVQEMLDTVRGFENFPVPAGKNIAIVTNSGGPGILCVDACESHGLKLADLSEETRNKLKEIVHPEGSIENPVDLLPGGTAEAFAECCKILTEDPNVDAVINLFTEPVMVKGYPVLEEVNKIESDKPIVQIVYPLPETTPEYWEKSQYQRPLFFTNDAPAKIFENMLFHSKAQKRLTENREEYKKLFAIEGKNLETTEKGFISQQEVNKVAEKYELPLITSLIVKPDELDSVDESYYPLVVKGISKDVVHKSELNAVKLNIKTKEELHKAAEEISESFKSHNYEVEEYLVQKFVKTKHEVLVGGFRDPSFGPMLMFGTGGKYVEVINDTSMKSAYLCEADIDDMINSTKMGELLKGVRGEAPANLPSLKKIIKSAAMMMIENKNIEEFDFNPLIIDEDGEIYAVDIRIKVN